jgi:hypothetical protein
MAPLYSTITLCAEVVISAVILYSIYSGYKNNRFPVILAGIALIYEIVFNISYMISRLGSHTNSYEPFWGLILAIFHGSLSLVMFIALIIFFILAWLNYRRGINYFKKHNILTTLFVIFWLLAVFSGILFYYVEYFTHL